MTTQQLVLDHLPLAATIARNMAQRLPRHVDAQDLVQEARIGLLDAASRFDARRGIRFGAYARRRMAGAILDGLRRVDHLSRDSRRKVKRTGEEIPAPQSLENPERLAGGLNAPDDCTLAAEQRRMLDAAIATLPARLQNIVRAYYREDRTMAEIGVTLGVNESRVSQLHARTLRLLREHFTRRGHTSCL